MRGIQEMTERTDHYCKKCGKHLGNHSGVKMNTLPFKCYMCALDENKGGIK